MAQPVYCARCGTLMERRLVDDRERDVCPACGFILYRNPVPAVGVVVALEGKVVLVRRRYPPRAGCWALPAGFMELGESAEEAAMRECHEETGLLVRVDHLLGAFSIGEGQGTGLLLIYAATVTAGELVAADDATEAGAFASDALPEPIAFPTHLQAIERWRRMVAPEARLALATSTMPGLQVRYATRADLAAALELLVGGRSWDDAQVVATEALLTDRLNDPDKPLLVAALAGQVRGLVLPAFHQALRGWYATLDDLVVDSAFRRSGVGTALVNAAAELARARGCTRVQVAFSEVEAGAREFLVACGFGSAGTLALSLE